MSTNHLIDYYQRIKNKKYALKSLLISNDYSSGDRNVEMTFTSLFASTDSFKLIFMDVSSLKIQPRPFPRSLVLSIQDLQANQWENISFQVFDVEEEIFSFFCKNITYLSLIEDLY